MLRTRLTTALLAMLPFAASATTQTELEAVLQSRLQGDRSGACIAAAVIDGGVTQAYVCAAGARPRVDARSAFEIGSITKTMNGTLLAQFLREGRVTLDTPLAEVLPAAAQVPQFADKPILLRHIVTHRSGLPALPPGFNPSDTSNPFATLDEAALLAALAATPLAYAPGEHFEYSNFATMLLSAGLARLGGTDYETLLRERLFRPLGMATAYIDQPAPGASAVQGRMSNGQRTPAWTFGPNLAGVGGVRATLGDMVRYLQAELGQGDAEVLAAMALTQQPVATDNGPITGINWLQAPLGTGTVQWHDGGTGGFASFAGFDRARNRGVILLCDTAIPDVVELGLHLFDESIAPGKPRRLARPPYSLMDALVGDYVIDSGPALKLRRQGRSLSAQVDGQPRLALGYDNTGDFFATEVDVVVRPQLDEDGGYRLELHGIGGMQVARRPGAVAGKAAIELTPKLLAEYVGEYPLLPGFGLRVTAQGAILYVQGTGQPPIALSAIATDRFVAKDVAAQLRFERRDGRVVALVLQQNGQELRGERQ